MSETFSAWMKQRRKKLDLTQKELADRVGCAVVTIQKYEEGRRRPSKHMAVLLATQLRVPAAEQHAFIRQARQGESPDPSVRTYYLMPRLPAPLTPLVGRQDEIGQIERIFTAGDSRLVTVLGPPGVGKTRAALDAAWRLAGHYAHGAVFVDLAAVSNEDQLVAALLQRLDLEAPETDKLPALLVHLAGRELLLVLDNFEHILPAAAIVDDLLRQTPRLHILVTSREPLRLYGETLLVLAPLPVAAGEAGNPKNLSSSPAAELFAARVRALQMDFEITAGNAALVETICRRLDGLPLALELAAVQIQRMGLSDLLNELEYCMELLSQERGNIPRRHLSLKSAVAWSTNLLAPEQRRAFHILGVFRGGFTAEAAAAVVGADHLPDLVATSLVQLVSLDSAEGRYGMLETMREIALAELEDAGLASGARRRHARYYRDLAGKAHAAHDTAEISVWQARLALEKSNIRNALYWCRDHDTLLGLELSVNMWQLWYLWGEYREGVRWLEHFLEKEQAATRLRARALRSTGVLFSRFAENERARSCFEASLQLSYQLEDDECVAAALVSVADSHLALEEYDQARSLYEQALSIFEDLGNKLRISWALSGLAACAERADEDLYAAADIMEKSIYFARQAGGPRHLAWMLGVTADILRDMGDLQKAQSCLAEGLALFIEVSDRPGQSFSKLRMAGLALEQEIIARARPLLDDCIRLAFDTYTVSYAAQAICLTGLLMTQDGELMDGVRLCTAAASIYPHMRQGLLRSDLAVLDARLSQARAALGDQVYEHLRTDGRTMRLAEGVEMALNLL